MFSIFIDTSTLGIRSTMTDNVTGTIALCIDDTYFPDKGWNDFVVIILDWWLSGMNDYLSKSTDVCECKFMDGGFSFEIQEIGTLWRVRLFKNGYTEPILERESIEEPLIVLKAFTSAANMVIRYCTEFKLSNRDLERLIKNHENLLKNIKSFK